MITINVTGLEELRRKLIELGDKVSTKILRNSGREAMKIVEEDMKKHAGFNEASSDEHMRDSIKIRSSSRKKRQNRVVSIQVGPTNKHYIKAFAQEYGTVKQIANPFIRPALDYNVPHVLRTLSIEIRKAIETIQQSHTSI